MHDVLSEVHDVEVKNRDVVLECRVKCSDHVLVSEGVLGIVEGIKLIKCNEIVELDHKGHSTYLYLEF